MCPSMLVDYIIKTMHALDELTRQTIPRYCESQISKFIYANLPMVSIFHMITGLIITKYNLRQESIII